MMELKDFEGIHELSGLEVINKLPQPLYGETSTGVAFNIDGVKYYTFEDGNDGYRSYMREIQEYHGKLSNTFPPHKVKGVIRMGQNDILDLYDCFTNKIVLSLGTDRRDEWYPVCRLDWYPENLLINAGK